MKKGEVEFIGKERICPLCGHNFGTTVLPDPVPPPCQDLPSQDMAVTDGEEEEHETQFVEDPEDEC